MGMTLIIEAHKQCEKCFHFQVCSSVLKNDLLIREAMRGEKEPKCKMFVEVVRCKDCKNWGGVIYGGRCKYWSSPLSGITHFTSLDDFCSYGERKDNGT